MGIEFLEALLLACLIFPLFFLLGTFSRPILQNESAELLVLFYSAIGMALAGYAVIVLASLHQLKLTPVAALMSIAYILTLRRFYLLGLWQTPAALLWFCRRDSRSVRFLKTIFFISCVLTFFTCFLPEIGHDALAYHLNLAKVFAAKGNIDPIPYDLKSFRTLFMPCLYILGILFKSVAIAKLMHWAAGFMLVLFLAFWLRQKTMSDGIAYMMAVMLLLTPTLFNQFTTTYTDVASTFFCFLSFYLFIKAREKQGGISLYFLSGLLMGTAIGCKLLTAMVPFAMVLVCMFEFLFAKKENRRFDIPGLAAFTAGVLLGVSYWFFRNYRFTGNPFYPFFTRWFGGGNFDAEDNFIRNMGIPKTFFNYLFIPFHTVFQPEPFDKHHWMGPFYLLMLPFAGVGAARDRQAAFALGCSWIVLTIWFYLSQNVRFLLPVFPIYLFAAGVGLSFAAKATAPRFIKQSFVFILALNIIFLFALGCRHYRIHTQAILEGWSQKKFLLRLERTYPAALWINKNLPPNARILSAEDMRQFYFDREIIIAAMLFAKDKISPDITEEQLFEHLKAIGITHVMRVRNDSRPEVPADQIMGALDAALKRSDFFKLMVSIRSENIREDRYRYEIYSINNSSAQPSKDTQKVLNVS